MAGVLEHLLTQVEEAEAELRNYEPKAIDWVGRAGAAVNALTPWLLTEAPGLKVYLERVLNAPDQLRSVWEKVRKKAALPAELIAAFEEALQDTSRLLEYLSGEVASSMVMAHLQARYPDSHLKANGKSDYPDLWLGTNDYSTLPSFSRTVKEYGAALKGKPPRPVRVPDGLEVKTCRDTLRVDCHHNHIGLHLAVILTERSRHFTVKDIAVAFLKAADYTRANRNTTATTEKFSFGGAKFISLLK